MTQSSSVFTPFTLGSMTLRNRVIRSAAFEGMSPGGRPSDALVEYHRQLAAGGVGMTTVAYASISDDGRTYDHQISLQRSRIVGELRRLTGAVQREGAAIAIQLGHGGYFSAPAVTRSAPIGPSRVFNQYTLRWPKVINDADIDRLATDFSEAASRCREAGFDAIELQAGHGYLLSQFLSPHTNRRCDDFGGSLDARLRFPLLVLQRIRQAVGDDYPILVKMNLQDGFAGGQTTDDAVVIARALADASADALVLSGGFVSKTPMYVMRGDVPFADMFRGQTSILKKIGLLIMGRVMVKRFDYCDSYFLADARPVRQAVSIPLSLVGGIRHLPQMEQLIDEEGFELLSMARPLVMEPDLITRMQRGEVTGSRCEPCNRCIALMDKGAVACPLVNEQQPGRR